MSSKALKEHERIQQSLEKKVHATSKDMDAMRKAAALLKGMELRHNESVNESNELSQKVQSCEYEVYKLQGK